MNSLSAAAASILLLLAAASCEIVARLFAWEWIREGRGILWGCASIAAIALSLVLPAFQGERFQFGRSTAAYGALFVALALIWNWRASRKIPEISDVVGGAFCLAGLLILMYWPRG